MPVSSTYDEIGLRFINDSEALELFNELTAQVQSKIVLDGLKKAGKPILEQAKTNFFMVKKDQSRTGYSALKKAFRIEPRRKTKDLLGVKVGINRLGYKYRWIEWGTDERTTFYKEAYRGKLDAQNFFYIAVRQKMPEAEKLVSEEITKSLERVMKKYANN